MAPMPRPHPARTKHRSNSYFYYVSRATAALLVMMAMAVIGILIIVTLAQERTTPAAPVPSGAASPYAAYFVAPDSNGINQLWGLTLPDGQSKPLTRAPQSVFHYDISDDHTQITFVSGGQIWRQTFGQLEAEPIIAISDEPDFAMLAFSPDGKSLAYHNNGLWLLNLATGTTEELLTDVPGHDEMRHYRPLHFLDSDRIMIEIGVWEGNTRGIYTLSSHTMQQVAGSYGLFELMPLQDGRYLAYSEARMGPGVEGFLIGQPTADPLEPFLLTPTLGEFFAENQLVNVAITDTIEVAPGVIRFIGSSFNSETFDGLTRESAMPMFMGEYNFNTNTFTLDTTPETSDLLISMEWIQGLSGDGRYIAGYLTPAYVNNVLQATLAVTNLETRTRIELTAPSPVSYFQWADRK